MAWAGWLSVFAVVLAAAALTVALLARRELSQLLRVGTLGRGGTGRGRTGEADAEGAEALGEGRSPRPQVAFIANPSKPDVQALRDAAVRACAARYLPEPMWIETTQEDPGVGQARQALAAGATVVVAVGGDGTVRAVAEGLVDSDASMGLLPLGTGNLLARNLDLPLGDVESLLRIALTGTDRKIDVGWLTVVRAEAHVADDVAEADPEAASPHRTPADAQEAARDHLFLVIAGLGFDAAMVADTDDGLKAKVGWIAYFVAGIRHLHARRMRLDVAVDEGGWHQLRLRSLLFGNCGRLPGGITLLPDAELDDGLLDIGAIDIRGGVVGWTQLFGEVAMQRFGVKTELPNKIGKIEHAQARRIRVRSRDAQQLQVDGDVLGSAFEVEARVDPLALTVKVP